MEVALTLVMGGGWKSFQLYPRRKLHCCEGAIKSHSGEGSVDDKIYRTSHNLLREHKVVVNKSAEGRMVKAILNEVSDGNEEQDDGGKVILTIKWQRIWLNCVYVLVLVSNEIEYLAEALFFFIIYLFI